MPLFDRQPKAASMVLVFSENVRNLRKARGWSQTELARRAGLAQRTISNIENIQEIPDYSPVLESLEKLAMAFRVPGFLMVLPLPVTDLQDTGIRELVDNYFLATERDRETLVMASQMAARQAAQRDA